MGTDIYLSWDKIKKKEKDNQCTGFSINSGDAGYLRASIGMHQENAILRKIFPIEYWEGEGEMRFVFNEKAMAKVSFYGRLYLAHAIMGVPVIKDSEFNAENYKVVVAIGDPKKRKKVIEKLPANQLRISGLLFAVIGFVIVWYFKR